MSKAITRKSLGVFSTIVALCLALVSVPAQAAPPAAVITTIDSNSASLGQSNVARKVAVAPNGDIYVAYTQGGGSVIAKSTNNGQSFSTVSAVANVSSGELAVSSLGNLYFGYVRSNVAYVKKSSDGVTWGPEIPFGAVTATNVHLAVDREFVYIIPSDGRVVLSSPDSGATTRSAALSNTSWVFADIAVDPLTGRIYPFVDRPQVSWFSSDDRGVTFSQERSTGKSVFFSVAAISSTQTSKFLYMAGSGTNLERLNLLDNSITTLTVSSAGSSQARTLAADPYGNVVSGAVTSGNLSIEISNDSGSTFASPLSVATNVTYGSVAINPANGDVLVAYQEGSAVKLARYAGRLVGYDLSLTVSAIDFASTPGTATITVTNVSSATINGISAALSNSIFGVSTTCSSLTAAATCTISITSTAGNEGTAVLSITANGGIQLLVPVSFGAGVSQIAPLPSSANQEPPRVSDEYRGPEFSNLGANVIVKPNQTFVLEGRRLDSITSLSLGGLSVPFKIISKTQVEITVPLLADAVYDLVALSSHGKLTHLNALNVLAAGVSTNSNAVQVSVTRLFRGSALSDAKLLEVLDAVQGQIKNADKIRCIANIGDADASRQLATRLCDVLKRHRFPQAVVIHEARSSYEKSGKFWVRVIAKTD